MIHDFLIEKGFVDLVAEYGLEPFDVRVQTIERTFIDKLYAICDYHLSNKVREHSRHLYDIHKLFPCIRIDDRLKELAVQTRMARKEKPFCLSATDGTNINELLQRIIDRDVYKQDYQDITVDLLFESVTYEQVIETLRRIAECGLF